MSKKLLFSISSFVLALGLVSSVPAAELVAHFPLDEGSGTTVTDISPNGRIGTLSAEDVSWIEGVSGSALEFNPLASDTDGYVESPGDPVDFAGVSLTCWVKNYGQTAWGRLVQFRPTAWCIELYTDDAVWLWLPTTGDIGGKLKVPKDGAWHFVGVACGNTLATIYIDDESETLSYAGPMTFSAGGGTQGFQFGNLHIGARVDRPLHGCIDDWRIYNGVLTAEEVAAIKDEAYQVPGQATNPNPGNKETDVCTKPILSWEPGAYPTKHDVYFSTDETKVTDADRDNTLGVLLSQDQDVSYYPTSGALALDFDTTYYWRIDEVNTSPDHTIHQGNVWQFTVEPIGYAIENVTATADSNASGQGPEKTINLDGDLHSTDQYEMWLSTKTEGAWILYEFDKVYKLHEMWVWNHNTSFEPDLGYGVQNAAIQYSTDGITYDTLGTTHGFDQAPGVADYAHSNEIPLNGVAARYVRITANSNFGGSKTGLSEVRFFYIPMRATKPNPTDESEDVALDVTLGWTPGREAATHDVYLGTDQQAVADGTIAPDSIDAADECEASYGPSLEMGKTYYWKVNEVNLAEEPNTWEGDVWSFSTPEYLVVDTMETYTAWDVADNNIFEVWLDGPGNCVEPGNGTGSILSVQEGSPAQGAKSMKYEYDNDGMVRNPCNSDIEGPRDKYSEAKANVADLPSGIGSDWTAGGVKALWLWFYGDPDNDANEPMWVKLTDQSAGSGMVTYGTYADEDVDDLREQSWHEWKIDLAAFGVDLKHVKDISIGFGNPGATSPGGSGVVYFDDIRLYPARCVLSRRSADLARVDFNGDCVVDVEDVKIMTDDWLADASLYVPLIAWYKLNEGAGNTVSDFSENDFVGTISGAVNWVEGKYGSALEFNPAPADTNGIFEVTLDEPILFDGFSFTCWLKNYGQTTYARVAELVDNTNNLTWIVELYEDLLWIYPGAGDDLGGFVSLMVPQDDAWHFVGVACGDTQTTLYVDGGSETLSYGPMTFNVDAIQFGNQDVVFGPSFNRPLHGCIDDWRIYNRELSPLEIESVKDGSAGSVPPNVKVLRPGVDKLDLYEDLTINFKDYAILAGTWLEEQLWPKQP